MQDDAQQGLNRSSRHRGDLNACLPALIRSLLGVVLAGAGIAKVFSLSDFAESLRLIAGVPQQVAMPIAAVVVVVECVLGAGLLFSRHSRVFTVATSTLFGVFIIVLTVARIQGNEAPCGCFGLLPVRLSVKAEIILDLLLFNIALLLWLFPRDSVSELRRKIWRRMVLLGAVFIQLALLFVALPSGERGGGMSALVRFVESEAEPFRLMASGSRLMLLADIHDFSCHPCFEDFLALCEAVRCADGAVDERRVIVLLRHRSGGGEPSPDVLQIWARETGIPFGVAVVPESVMVQAGVGRSAAVLLEAGGREVFRRDFPIGVVGREEIVDLFSAHSTVGRQPM